MALTPAQIARRMVRGVALVSLAQYGSIAVGVIRAMILARIVPIPYHGAVTFAVASVSFLTILRIDLKDAVTSTPGTDQARLFTAFLIETISTASGFLLAIALSFFFPGSCSPACWTAIWVLLGVRLFAAFTSVPLYILQRDIEQGVITRLTLFGAVLSLGISLVFVLSGFPVLALLTDMTVPVVVLGLGAWLWTGWMPRPAWDREAVRHFFSFGVALWIGSLFGKITFEFDDWLVGRLNGDSALGLYGKAYVLAKMPMDIFGGVIAQLAVPLYAQSNNAGSQSLSRAYHLATWAIARLIAFSGAVTLAGASEIILILAGPAWMAAVPLLQLMALYVIGRPFFQNNAQLLVAMHQPGVVTRMFVLQAIVLLILGPLLVLRWGAAGAGIAVSLMMIIGLASSQIALRPHLNIDFRTLYGLPFVYLIVVTPALLLISQPSSLIIALPTLYRYGAAAAYLAVKVVLALLIFVGIIFRYEYPMVLSFWGLAREHLLPSKGLAEAPE